MTTQLNDQDLRRIVGGLPRDILDLLKAHPVQLAGGYIRAKIAGEPVSDIDLFCPDAQDADRYATMLAAERAVKAFRTRNAYTIIAPPRMPVQFIHRWTYDGAAALVGSFDFTIAQACVWFDQEAQAWRSICGDRFYADLAAKRLTYTFPARNEDAGGSLLRVQKFLGRGYHVPPEELAKVMARLLGGVRAFDEFWRSGEVARAAVLTGLLREADPLTVIDGLRPSDDCLEVPPAPEAFVDAAPWITAT